MKASHLLFPLLIWGMTAKAKSTTPAVAASSNLNFIENKGQVRDQYGKSRDDIDFRVGTAGLNMFVGNGQLHYQWATQLTKNSPDDHLVKTVMYRMDVTLIGANIHAQVTTENKQGYYERYYQPGFGEQGATALAYQKITYKDMYPNIDWVLYVKDNTIEYDFVVRPGGKVSDIQLQYGGATAISVDNTGKLTATTLMGSVSENAPVSYQSDGKKVNTRFVLNGDKLSFSTDDYTGTLVIDPTLSWSTYYGGSGSDNSRYNSVSGDRNGNIYLGGYTVSTGLATVGSFQDTLTSGSQDGFLAKFNASGSLVWCTYYGGSNSEYVYGVACDTANKIYLAGYTNSSMGIATAGAYQTTLGTTGSGTDAFLIQFDSTGARQWGTYYGGTSTDQGLGVACDKTGNVYLTGVTQSTLAIATAGAYQTARAGGSDAFLAKFNTAGTLKWATYYGGNSTEKGYAVTCDTSMNVYITGYTQSTSGLASVGAYQTTIGGSQDVFLGKFDSTGVLQWSTYLGGADDEESYGVGCDPYSNVYIAGYTYSTSGIATVGSFQPIFDAGLGDGEAFISRFNSSGSLIWSTYYGKDNSTQAAGISCDQLGNIYMVGTTSADSNIATPGAYQDTVDVADAYLVKFDTAGNRIWGTYFGGESANDNGNSVFCNNLSKIYIAGTTDSYMDIATAGSYQTSFGGGSGDAFLAKFDDCTLTQPDTLIGYDTVCRGGAYTYSIPAVAGATSYFWTLPAGWAGSSMTDTIHVTAGTHSDTIEVAASFACGMSNRFKRVITVNPLPVITPAGTFSICNGDSITLTASTGTTYQWLKGGSVIAGAHSNTYATHSSDYYSVIVTSTSGCADTSAADTVIVHPTPLPVITVIGMTLNTGIYTSYQWNRNSTPITGAVNQTYTMVVNTGDYTVTVVDSNGCTGTSAVYNPTEGVASISSKNGISIYPNPTTGIINITAAEKINLEITSSDGKLLGTYREPKEIDLSSFSDGIYFLRISTDNGGVISIQKMVKAKTR